MLKYAEAPHTCTDVLAQKNINIDNKNSLKAASTMMRAYAKHRDGLKQIDSCIIPSYNTSIFGSTECTFSTKKLEDDNVQNTYTLPITNPGTLSLDHEEQQTQLESGMGVYPTKGCLHKVETNHSLNFMDDMGKIMDFHNQKMLYLLKKRHDALIQRCGELDIEIASQTTNINSMRNENTDQQAACANYLRDIDYYRNKIAELKQKLQTKRAYIEQQRRAAEAAINAAVRNKANNKPVVYIHQHCGYNGWRVALGPGRYTLDELTRIGFVDKDASSISFLRPGSVTIYEGDNFQGRSLRFNNHIHCLVNYGFNDAVSSIIVDEAPPPPPNRLLKSHNRNNFCVDVAGWSRHAGGQVFAWDCHGGANQRWRFDDKSRLVSQHSGQCLDVYGGGRHNGAAIIQWPCHDGWNQKWTLDGQGKLRSWHSGKCLDVYGYNTGNGSRLVTWDCHGDRNQRYSFL